MSYQLIGYIAPSFDVRMFLISVFSMHNDYYFMRKNKEMTEIIAFDYVELFDERIKKIQSQENLKIGSKPLFIYRDSEKNILIGTYETIKPELEKIKDGLQSDSIEREELEDFFEIFENNRLNEGFIVTMTGKFNYNISLFIKSVSDDTIEHRSLQGEYFSRALQLATA